MKLPLFYRFARTVCAAVAALIYNCKFEGLNNFPEDGGFILVCNHRSYVDPVLLGLRLKHPLVFMAKAELFKIPVLGFLMKKLGAFEVSRGIGGTSALDFAIKTVNEGKALALFPEGTRSKTGELKKPKSGVVVIAAQTGSIIIPAAISFQGKLRFRRRITIRYGKPIDPKTLKIDLTDRSTIRTAANTVMNSISELLE
ncbi:MAG: 1-acyl-sn-glycerol-3-phosphate acyltransferase [Oscillospiraceae bacterium]|nr:1-acyl-sn-glycerol-3-phosphate acyltransferase [Oscillospiraceae bacterium]